MRVVRADVGRSDNGAAWRFGRSTSFCVPRQWGKGDALAGVISLDLDKG